MSSIDAYMVSIPEERMAPLQSLIDTINANIPEGFSHEMQYGMPAWVVPMSTYPSGYHCTPDTPLPFCQVANRKNFIAFYHMGLYADSGLHDWFVEAYPDHSKYKLDMGKSCIRFKKVDHIPEDLIAQLIQRMTVDDWIKVYEANIKGK
jgi:uncharacterized protein YdhG (YjbR/CyaY superfamily)